MTELHYQSALEIGSSIHMGKYSAEEVTRALLQRIEEQQELNAFVTLNPELSLAQAVQADEEIRSGSIRSPLHGVPIALKDLLFTSDWPTTSGTTLFNGYMPQYNATVVSRLREAGTVTLGKLKLVGKSSTRTCFLKANERRTLLNPRGS